MYTKKALLILSIFLLCNSSQAENAPRHISRIECVKLAGSAAYGSVKSLVQGIYSFGLTVVGGAAESVAIVSGNPITKDSSFYEQAQTYDQFSEALNDAAFYVGSHSALESSKKIAEYGGNIATKIGHSTFNMVTALFYADSKSAEEIIKACEDAGFTATMVAGGGATAVTRTLMGRIVIAANGETKLAVVTRALETPKLAVVTPKPLPKPPTPIKVEVANPLEASLKTVEPTRPIFSDLASQEEFLVPESIKPQQITAPKPVVAPSAPTEVDQFIQNGFSPAEMEKINSELEKLMDQHKVSGE